MSTRPASTVTHEAWRNQNSARVRRAGTTIGRVVASSVRANGTFTKLNQYRKPIQVIPARKWNQRTTISTSPGNIETPPSGRPPSDAGILPAARRRARLGALQDLGRPGPVLP